MSGKFEIYTGNNGEYYFRLKAANGQNILASEGYKTKASAANGVESVRKNCGREGAFECREAKNGKHYFIIKATNGQEIGRSQMYASMSGCTNGMESVKTNGCSDRCDDLT